MIGTRIKILLIESNSEDAHILQNSIATIPSNQFDLTHSETSQQALQHLHNEHFDIILMSLVLADYHSMKTYRTIHQQVPDVPIVIISDRDDEDIALNLVREGVEDYLVKEHHPNRDHIISPTLLAHTIRYAIERHRMQSEMKHYTQRLEANESRFRMMIEKNADGIIILDTNGIVQFMNPSAETLFARKASELLGESFGFPVVTGETTELDVVRRNGKVGVAEMRVVETAWENTSVYLATFHDITERKEAEARRMARYIISNILSQSETLWSAIPNLLQAICEGTRFDLGELWLIDPESHILHWGGTWSIPSLDMSRLKTSSRSMTFITSDKWYSQVWEDGNPVWIDDILTEADVPRAELLKETGLHTAVAFPIHNGQQAVGVMIFFRRIISQSDEETLKMLLDIGRQIGLFIARKRAEEELRSAHRALRTLNECNQALIHASDETDFLHDICRIIVEVGGYRLAWAGFAEQQESEKVRIVAQSGYENEFIDSFDVTWMNVTRGHGPTSRAIRNGVPCVAKNILTDTTYTALHKQATVCGYASSVALPLINNGNPFGVLNIYAAEPDAFGRQEVQLLMEMANDLAYGIIALRTRSERDRAERELRLYTERLKNMREIDQAILTAQTPEAIAQAALSHIRRLVPYHWASIVGYEGENGTPTTLVADVKNDSSSTTFAPPGTRLPMISPSTSENMNGLTAQYVEDLHAAYTVSRTFEQLIELGIRSYLSVPLIAGSLLIGGINLGSTKPHAFNDQHLSIAHEVADQMAVAIQHARLFEQVQAGRERLQTLSRRLMEVQEGERHHLARELHDEIGQSLTAVKISLQAVQRQPSITERTTASLEESISIVDHVLQQVRNLSLDLRPSLLDDLGLEAALRWYLDRQAQWSGLNIEFVTDLQVPRLPPELETVCFRVTQEAITNIMRHAQAHRVWVELQQDEEELHLYIQDDGIGFDVQAAQKRAVGGSSLGLLGMQERVLFAGGKITIVSKLEKGTEISVWFPMNDHLSPVAGV